MTGPVRIKSGVRAPSAPDPGWRERIAAEELADLVAAGRRFAPDLSRGVKVPDSRAAHRDDALAELQHGRIGRAAADRRAAKGQRLTAGDYFFRALYVLAFVVLAWVAATAMAGGLS